MKTKFSGILTLLLAFVVQITFAQDKTISGTVADESGLPLPGVNIIVKGTTNGTQTDFDGKYTIQANAGDVLSFTYLGLKSREVTVGASNTINVTMEEDAAVLQEVVVTALGLEKKKDQDLSSSTTVSTEAITRAKESGLIQGLAGKTSGLKITRNSGDPGAGAYIQIRGQNSLSGNSDPLIIIDGVAVSNTSVGGGTAGVTQQSRLNDINSDDIASVTVLKGVAAASVWGAGAANGVIVITTKKGSVGVKKTTVTVKSSVAIDQINIEFDKQSTFGQGYPLWWEGVGSDFSSNGGVWRANTGFSWGDRISARAGGDDAVTIGNRRFEAVSGNIIYPITAKNSREVYNQTNRDQVFGDGITLDNSVGISFGGEASNTYMSFSDWNQDGIINGKSNYRRQTLRINHTAELSDQFTAKFNANYSKIKSDRIQQGSNLQGLYLGYLRTSPDYDNRDYKGTYYNASNVPTLNSHRGYRRYLGDAAPVYNNPGWTINEQDNPNAVERFIFAPEVNWKLAENMTVIARYGIDYYTDHRETFFPVNSAGGAATGSYAQDEIQEKTETANIFIQSQHDVSDNFNFGWILGAALDRNQYARLSGSSNIFTNPNVDDLRIFGNATAANELPTSFKSETRKAGAYAVLNAELFNQFYFEASGRLERSSTFEGNVFYPSASVGWQFSEVIGESDVFSFGKLRVAYGEIGITPNPYATSTLYGPGGIFASWGDGLSAANYGNPFTRSNTLGNPNLKEERVKELEFGADLRFLKNRLTLGLTYYDRITEDAILNIDVPSSTGFNGTLANAAELTNKGFEADLSYKILVGSGFNWSINANFSQNKNEVTDLNGVQSVFLAGFTGTSSRIVEGHAVGTLWGGKFERNASGDLVLDANGFPTIAAEEGVLGDPNPDWIGGLGTVLSYKGFTLSAQLETSQGNDHWTGTEGVLKFFGIHPETANESTASQNLQTYDGRTITSGTTFRGNIGDFGAGPVALDSEWYTSDGGGFGNQSESFVKDASWTRLREISLAYQLPNKLVTDLGFSDISVTVSGRNLALWTKIEGFDPDLNLTGATLGRGLDYFTNPATKTYAFTLNLTF
ncbi:SusC/RagA family TonB-linked outer membrane protein [Geojedonia litorea]|uniref:SusC/RagA family TonB-linked outer membrane protein n=1 Tax=Geojedonia litorea TaxID=1268269 RepID=A0ABV9N1V9_9FLAO